MSGLSRTPGKRVWANTHRGFESRPLRQIKNRPLWAVFYLVVGVWTKPLGFYNTLRYSVLQRRLT
jgi:hypothetical protein